MIFPLKMVDLSIFPLNIVIFPLNMVIFPATKWWIVPSLFVNVYRKCPSVASQAINSLWQRVQPWK